MGKGNAPPDSDVKRFMIYPELQGEYGRLITNAESIYGLGDDGTYRSNYNIPGASGLEQSAFNLTPDALRRARAGSIRAQGVATDIATRGADIGGAQSVLSRAMNGNGPSGGMGTLRTFAGGGGVGAGGTGTFDEFARGGGVGAGGQGTYDLFARGGGVGAGGQSTYDLFARGGGVGQGGQDVIRSALNLGPGGEATFADLQRAGALGSGGQDEVNRLLRERLGEGGLETLRSFSQGNGVDDRARQLTSQLAEAAAGSNFGTDYAQRAAGGEYVGGGNPYIDKVIGAANRSSEEAYRRAVGSLEGRLSMAGVGGDVTDAERRLKQGETETFARELGDTENRIRYQSYEAERERQQQAGLALPGELRANLGAQLAASGQLDEQTLARAGLRLNAAGQLEAATLNRRGQELDTALAAEDIAQGRAGIRLGAGQAAEAATQGRAGIRLNTGQALDQAALERAGLRLSGAQGQEQGAQFRAGARLQGAAGQEQGAQFRAGARLQGAEGQENAAQFRGNLRFQGAQALDQAALSRYQASINAAQGYASNALSATDQRLQAAGALPGLGQSFLTQLGSSAELGGLQRGIQERQNLAPFEALERYTGVIGSLAGSANPGAGAAAAQGYQSRGQQLFGNILALGSLGTGALGAYRGTRP